MRRPTHHQSVLRTPFNQLLGTEANVRILRALAQTDTPLSASELARRTRLGIAGVGKALRALVETGVVELVGVGTRRPARLRPRHPFAGTIRALFQAEAERVGQMIARLREAARRVSPPPKAVWIQGPVATEQDRLSDAVVVGILAASGEIERARAALEEEIERIERHLDVAVEVLGHTMADLVSASQSDLRVMREVIPLLGPPPLSLLPHDGDATGARTPRAGRRSHVDADARARSIAAAIAERLETDPSLVQRARAQVAQRMPSASSGERRELREWDRILRTMSLPQLRRFLVDGGERAMRLRQSLPFAGALSQAERDAASRGSVRARRRVGSKVL
ncbi:MAG: winged helix-turn-helix domain-containing protein [Gemmatimonadaceae bacterium]